MAGYAERRDPAGRASRSGAERRRCTARTRRRDWRGASLESRELKMKLRELKFGLGLRIIRVLSRVVLSSSTIEYAVQ